MSQYIYAIIPYESGVSFCKDEPYPCVWNPFLPELKDIHSEFTEPDSLSLFKDFLMINTCYRQSAFTDNRDGFCWIRADICKIARALGASEVWYVAELITDEMEDWDFSFNEWRNSLNNEKKDLVVELSIDVLMSKNIYSYYHDDFRDVIMERPVKNKKQQM
jgi:hypothetical protein